MSQKKIDLRTTNTEAVKRNKAEKHYDTRILESDKTLRWAVILFVVISISVFALASL